MKVNEILVEGSAYPVPKFDAERGHILGGVKAWHEKIGATKEDLESAIEDVKKSDLWNKLKAAGLTFNSTPKELNAGTLSFKQPVDENDIYKNRKSTMPHNYIFNVYGNGQIRQYLNRKNIYTGAIGKNGIYRLKSPKPKLIAGDPQKSLVSIYMQALEEILNKLKTKQDKITK